jgi:hypothetical protein
MSRKTLLIPFVAAVFLAAPTFAPAALPGLSGSALAAKNLNTSRSNIYRTKTRKAAVPKANARATTVKSSKSNSSDRATTVKSSKSNTSDRARTTTVKSSKSNTSDRAGPVRGGRLLPF